MQITITANDEEVRKGLAELQDRLRNLSPVMKQISQIVRTSVIKNFEVGGRPRWKPSKRAQKEGGLTLVKSGRLRNSIVARGYADRAEVGTNVIYAAIHQFRGRTPARTILPVNKKALFCPAPGIP